MKISNPILKVKGLTETQVNAIGFGAEYSSLADNYSIIVDDVYREATLKALEVKGYLSEKSRLGGNRWLTPKGKAVRQEFSRSHQEKYPNQYCPD